MSEDKLPKLTCVMVGDDGAGKTCLIISYITNVFPEEYVPTVFDNYDVRILIGDQPYSSYLCDTVGNDEYDTLRPLSYHNADVILICFSVVSPNSVVRLFKKWKSEMAKYCPGKPYVLVGTQTDLRDNSEVIEKLAENKQTPISTFDGEVFARELMAISYMECSALSKKGVHRVFDEAILVALQFPKTKQSSCVLM